MSKHERQKERGEARAFKVRLPVFFFFFLVEQCRMVTVWTKGSRMLDLTHSCDEQGTWCPDFASFHVAAP